MVLQLGHFTLWIFCFDIQSIDDKTRCSAKLVQETIGSPFSLKEDLKMWLIPTNEVCVITGGPVHTF